MLKLQFPFISEIRIEIEYPTTPLDYIRSLFDRDCLYTVCTLTVQ